MRVVAGSNYSFKVAGDDLAGWTILAVPDQGAAIPLIGIYVSRVHAIDEMSRVAQQWVADREGASIAGCAARPGRRPGLGFGRKA